MRVFLASVDHVFADVLELLIDLAGSDHIGVEGLPEGVGQGADHAAVDEAVGALLAPAPVHVAHQVVVQGGGCGTGP